MSGEMEVDADIENHHAHNSDRKRPHKNGELNGAVKVRRISINSATGASEPKRAYTEVSGRIAGVELENFMCHGHLKVDFETSDNNCFYIGGPNGSGKSALFASLNIGLGGRGNNNDRGNSVKSYIKEGRSKAKIRLILTNTGLGSHPDYGDYIVVERTITPSASTYALKSIKGLGRNRHEVLVSKKKTDLDQLLVRYGIQLNNPIFWMSQDRSRHFLHQMKPDRLYQKIQILEKKREKFLEESEHLQKRIQETAAKKDEFILEASSVRQKINEEGDILQALKGKMRLKESKIRDLQSEISNQDSKRRGMERSRGSFEQRKQRIIEQIAKFEEESQCEKRKEEAAATQVKMEKITNKETELVERLRLAQQQRDELQRLHEQAVSDQNEAVRESRKVSTQVNELEQELHRSEITAKNAVMSAMKAELKRLQDKSKGMQERIKKRKSLDELNIQIAELEEEFLKLDEETSQKQSEIRQINEELKEIKADFAEAKKRVTELEVQHFTVFYMIVSSFFSQVQNEEEDIRAKIRGVDTAVDADRTRQDRLRESILKMDASHKELEEEKATAEERIYFIISSQAKRSEELPTPPSMTNPPDMDQLGDTAELDEQYKTLTMKIHSAEKMQVSHRIVLRICRSFTRDFQNG
ncbi:hypothetical protein ANCCEY_14569 [Ancylostoma ceylanicum]|uniref:Rad50/SbcC-type AAA domain-containing protein n=1 Tax=Ancylostoma ceylanicum TaxID=53326 RepID=A0A0D6L9J0_9BILA|nr:hypothetical protein ANCCEY_14569 [Ancylostoma ceylanicum]